MDMRSYETPLMPHGAAFCVKNGPIQFHTQIFYIKDWLSFTPKRNETFGRESHQILYQSDVLIFFLCCYCVLAPIILLQIAKVIIAEYKTYKIIRLTTTI